MRPLAAALCALVLSLPVEAGAVAASALIGAPARDLQGRAVGEVEDLIIDLRDERVLYVIVHAGQRFLTLPIRALHAADRGATIDMSFAGDLLEARDPNFRRAGRLIGQPRERPGSARIGAIADIEFEPPAGDVVSVAVDFDGKRATLPPSVLAHGGD